MSRGRKQNLVTQEVCDLVADLCGKAASCMLSSKQASYLLRLLYYQPSQQSGIAAVHEGCSLLMKQTYP